MEWGVLASSGGSRPGGPRSWVSAGAGGPGSVCVKGGGLQSSGC